MAIRRVGAEELRRQLTHLLNRVGYGGEEVIVERNGKPIAVLVPYESYEPGVRNTSYRRSVADLAAEIEAAREAAGIPFELIEQQLHEERLRTLREKYPELYELVIRDSPA